MPKPMSPMAGRGKEISDYLRRELGVPELCQRFAVIIDKDECIQVQCDYLPRDLIAEAKANYGTAIGVE